MYSYPCRPKLLNYLYHDIVLIKLFLQQCEDDTDCANALQAISNVTSPSSTNASEIGMEFFKDGGLKILQERFEAFGSLAPVCEAACRLLANLSMNCGSVSAELTEKMAEIGTINSIVATMGQHGDQPLLQGEACRAICNIAAQSLAAKDKVNSLHGFQLVLASQKKNEEIPEFWNGRFAMKRLVPDQKLMCNYEGQGRWISGVVTDAYQNGTYDVAYAHGGAGKRIPAHLVRPKDQSDNLLEFCATWLWKPNGRLTEDELNIKADGMVSLSGSGQVGTWSVAEKDDGRAAIKLQIGSL